MMNYRFSDIRKIILSTFLFLLFTTAGCGNKNVSNKPIKENATSDYANTSYNNSEKAPNFILTDTNGKQVKLSDYKGKIVILDFWATWCPPCRRGIPDLIELQKTYKKYLAIIGISLDIDSRNDVVPFMKKYGINYKVVYGNNDVVRKYGNIQAIPTSFIIDKKGEIVTSFVGLQRKETYKDQIDKLIKKL